MLDKQTLQSAVKGGVDKARQFNASPPKWFYWAAGIVIILAIQALRVL